MRETVSLLVMWTGISIAMYGVGMPIEWVVVVLVVAFIFIDFMILRPKRIGSQVKKKRGGDQVSGAEVTRELFEKDEPKDEVHQVAPIDSPSISARSCDDALMPDSATVSGRSAHSAFLVHTTKDSLDPPTGQATFDVKLARVSMISSDAKAGTPSPRNTAYLDAENHAIAAVANRSEDLKVALDPLAQYQPEQFKEPPRSAPVEVFTPMAAAVRTSSPVGPAWAPPHANPRPPRSANTPRAPRPIPQVLKPEDFQQNAGKKGYLYLARNPEHWHGLFKVGQTIHHPSRRVTELNKQHAKHKDIGLFDLLEVVEVVDAYGAEQVLFKVLNDLRPVEKREFFIADQGYLSMVMHAVADFIRGHPDALNQIYRDLDPQQFPSWPGRIPRYIHHGVGRAKGWVYLARCQYHFADTYLFGATAKHPETALRELNEGQKKDTPQIGFYTMVFALPVLNTKASRIIGWQALSPWKLKGSLSYIRGPLDQISRALTDSLSAPSP